MSFYIKNKYQTKSIHQAFGYIKKVLLKYPHSHSCDWKQTRQITLPQ